MLTHCWHPSVSQTQFANNVVGSSVQQKSMDWNCRPCLACPRIRKGGNSKSRQIAGAIKSEKIPLSLFSPANQIQLFCHFEGTPVNQKKTLQCHKHQCNFFCSMHPQVGVQIAEKLNICFGSKAEQFFIASKITHCLLMRMSAQPQAPQISISQSITVFFQSSMIRFGHH